MNTNGMAMTNAIWSGVIRCGNHDGSVSFFKETLHYRRLLCDCSDRLGCDYPEGDRVTGMRDKVSVTNRIPKHGVKHLGISSKGIDVAPVRDLRSRSSAVLRVSGTNISIAE
jgi:hypothetical protein